jgi:hypothetical protein
VAMLKYKFRKNQIVGNEVCFVNKSEALAVLHEIYEACKESARINVVSLDGSQVSHIFTGGYQLKMKLELDSSTRDVLKAITTKHKLLMKEQNGYVVLYSLGD